jgi:hypothetical protein
MEPMVPWLLLVISGLIVTCALMYSQMRQVETTSRGRQSIIADELRDAEEALLSALERVRRMDQELAARESRLTSTSGPLAPPTFTEPFQTGGLRGVTSEDPPQVRSAADGGARAPKDARRRVGDQPAPRPASEPADWRARAVECSRRGASPRQIAQELGLPVGEVELVLALER